MSRGAEALLTVAERLLTVVYGCLSVLRSASFLLRYPSFARTGEATKDKSEDSLRSVAGCWIARGAGMGRLSRLFLARRSWASTAAG